MSSEFNVFIERSHFKTITLKLEPEAGASSEISQTFFTTKAEDEKYGLLIIEADDTASQYGRIDNFFCSRQEVIGFLNLLIRNKVTLATLNDVFTDYVYERLESSYSEGNF